MVVFRGGIKVRDGKTLLIGSIPNVEHQNGGLRLRTWLIGVLLFLVASLLFLNTFITGQFRLAHLINATALRNSIVDQPIRLVSPKISGYLVNNKGCRIAALDPFDPISRRFIEIEKPFECENGTQFPLIESNETAIYVNLSAQYHYYNKSESPNCCWTSFTRKAGQDNAVTFENRCHSFEGSARIEVEFVKVECFREKQQIYRDYHAFLPRKNKTEKRCEYLDKKLEDRLSVLIVGLDAVSRLNFHRMMPKTVKALKRLDAIELLGYNKVGDNTYPNLVPVLCGLSSKELETAYMGNNKKKPYDDGPFIWKNYSESGYRTIFGEDACSMTTFNYLKPGFRNPPTDYYLRPYCVAAESDIGNNHKLNANLCLGGRKNFESLLQYTSKVAKEFVSKRYFGFFWQASLTHDFLNYPQLGDVAYSSFFRSLGDDKLLNNTVLVVMSDHGMRWGSYRQTYQGRMEGSLPFVFFVFPDWWKLKYSKAITNLRRNTVSLTTPYDLHETLIDILTPDNLSEESMLRRNRLMHAASLPRGISMFSPIPDYRTCSMADISEHWCMCHTSNSVSLNDTRVHNATSYLIEQVNALVKNYPQCSFLKLKKLKDAKMWIGSSEEPGEDIKDAPWIDFTITVATEPGGAIFEASIRHNATSNKLVGPISRLNAYGTQSACVDDFNTRLYCYCY
ncbi:uncharacterized protein [Venturia canescens]|uniref:uncharacterized protein isoform X2 n=1 Tax=Venturia canescens TaxID=32260 RepID=UPI001C9C5321|nr:uncharacterized protein LOC122411606 isoform X2 [Venturia canescens]